MNSRALASPEQIQEEIKTLGDQLKLVLPPHISKEKFVRIIVTAMQKNEDLMAPDINKPSLYIACMEAAQDGLAPDGKEAALVVYNTNVGTKEVKKFVKKVQYMPMIAGLRKKVLEHPDILKWDIRIVKENDEFDYQLGSDERIVHRPAIKSRGKTVACYGIAVLRSGSPQIEVMNLEELEAIRNKSREKDGVTWRFSTDEMYRKTLGHRQYKSLPHSNELDMYMRRFEGQMGIPTDSQMEESLQQGEPVKVPAGHDPVDDAANGIIEGEIIVPRTSEPEEKEILNGAPSDNDIKALIHSATNEDDLLTALSVINDLKDNKRAKVLIPIYRERRTSIMGRK